MPKCRSLPNVGWTLLDGTAQGDGHTTGLAGIPHPALPARRRQVAEEAKLSTGCAVDELVDCLVTDACSGTPMMAQVPRDLLRRPGLLEPLDHIIGQLRIAVEFAQALAPAGGRIVSYGRELPVEVRISILERVPCQLPVDGGPVAADPIGDGFDRCLGCSQAEDGPALLKRQLPVALSHAKSSRGANAYKS